MMLGVSLPAFPGSQWLAPIFSLAVLIYGGLPFLQMAVPEVKKPPARHDDVDLAGDFGCFNLASCSRPQLGRC